MVPERLVLVGGGHQLLHGIFHSISLAVSKPNLAADRTEQSSDILKLMIAGKDGLGQE